MDNYQPKHSKAKALGHGLATAGFIVPSIAVGATVALVVSQYTPLVAKTVAATPAQEAAGADLKTVDTSNVQKETATPATESLDPSAYGMDAANLKDGTYEGTGTGFRGSITVRVTIAGGKIVAIDIVSSADDPAYFGRAQAITQSVISAQSTSVDTISGATYSSKGLLMAIKNALVKASGGLAEAVAPAPAAGGSSNKPHHTIDPFTPAGGYADGVYTDSAWGYSEDTPVSVRVTIANGKIANIELVNTGDTPEYWSRAWNALPGLVMQKQSVNVDTVTGATYSSEGILGAIQGCLKQAAAGTKDPEPAPGPDPAPNPDPSPDTPDEVHYADGDFTGYALCKNEEDDEAFSPYYVKLTVTVKDGKVTGIHDIEGVGGKPDESLSDALDPFDEDNEPYLDNAIDGRTFRGTVYTGIPEQLLAGTEAGKIDVVARATYSSRAIANAYTDALARSAAAYKDANDSKGDKADASDKTNAPDEPTANPTAANGATEEAGAHA